MIESGAVWATGGMFGAGVGAIDHPLQKAIKKTGKAACPLSEWVR